MKYYFLFIYFQSLWFGGDLASIVGECACSDSLFWNEDELECQTPTFGSVGMIILFILIALVATCGCCCGGFLIVRKILK